MQPNLVKTPKKNRKKSTCLQRPFSLSLSQRCLITQNGQSWTVLLHSLFSLRPLPALAHEAQRQGIAHHHDQRLGTRYGCVEQLDVGQEAIVEIVLIRAAVRPASVPGAHCTYDDHTVLLP